MKRDEYMDGAGLVQERSYVLASNKSLIDHDRSRRIAWWREARCGLFVHWGLIRCWAGSGTANGWMRIMRSISSSGEDTGGRVCGGGRDEPGGF